MCKTIDLHTHSYCSDGTFSPEGLVILAKKQGLSAIALTDHDTIDGLELFLEAGEKHGMETICGIEFAALYEGFHRPEIHIVGLGFDRHDPMLLEKLEEIRQSRDDRNERMAKQLTAIGSACFSGRSCPKRWRRNHHPCPLCQCAVGKETHQDRKEAFSKYLSPGCPGYVERQFLTPKGCIEAIKNAGGAAVLAHPTLYDLDMTQVETLCKELISFGLDGIECRYSTYTPAQTKAVEKIARTLGLLPSGGSDFHGENKPDIRLGKGMGNLQIPYTYWEDLRTRCR